MIQSLFRKPKAFTLIELLIVVAIIAILAAIAVPNFLEAQTRSKVSRVKSDMRAIATALESYAVDNNKYPHAYTAAGTINPRIRRLVRLTTPVSYITTIPIDIFNRELPTSPTVTEQEIRAFLYVDRASYGQHARDPFGVADSGTPDTTRNLYRNLWGRDYPSSAWLLRSRGPVGEAGTAGALGGDITRLSSYDPSNGTVSRGNIFMLGGAGFIDGK